MAPGYLSLPSSLFLVNTPDDASLDITGDLDIRVLVDPTLGWASGQNFVFYAKRDSASITNLAYQFQTFRLPGNTHLRIIWKDSGGTERSLDSSTNTHALTGANWVRAVLDVNNGSGQASALFYTSQEAITTAPASVAWTQHGTTVNGAFGTTSIASGAALSELGSYDDGTTLRMEGKFYYAEVRNGIGGTIVANPDFRDSRQITTPNTVWTDDQGRVWTIQSGATWVPDTSEAFVGMILGSIPYVAP